MTTTVAEPAAPAAHTATCPRCGAAVAPDQDWCLSCGTALTTRIERPPSLRTPVAIAVGALTLAIAALVVALVIAATNGPDKTVINSPVAAAQPAPAATTPAATTPAATTPAVTAPAVTPTTPAPPAAGSQPGAAVPGVTPGGAAGGGKIQSWPAGKSGYTVVLESATSRAAAQSRARQIAATGAPVGVLDSSKFSTLRGGFFVVFSGVYDTMKQAQAALGRVRSAAPSAYARQVKPR